MLETSLFLKINFSSELVKSIQCDLISASENLTINFLSCFIFNWRLNWPGRLMNQSYLLPTKQSNLFRMHRNCLTQVTATLGRLYICAVHNKSIRTPRVHVSTLLFSGLKAQNRHIYDVLQGLVARAKMVFRR